MTLADWKEYVSPTGEKRVLELRSDKVYEGSKALFIDADELWLLHNQTLNDKPVSGAVKTYFLFPSGVYSLVGAVFKADLNGNCLAIDAREPNIVSLWQYSDGNGDEIEYIELDMTFQEDIWYIFEAICDDENNTITVRIKDVNENILAETAFSNAIPAELKGVGGGIGMFAYSEGVYYDLTKIYYP